MTMRLATELSDEFAAVAVVAATMDEGTARDATKVNPVSVLIMHGRKDPLVPFGGGSVHGGAGGPILSHDSAVRWWVNIDGCQRHHLITILILDSAGDGTSASYQVYPGGAGETEVVDYEITNGGHTWPGGWQYLPVFLVGKTTRNLNASEIIWAFFQRHSRR
jgi:polyhydroxybutyrate depolymerase